MKDLEFIPARFRLSSRARAKLNELTDTASGSEDRKMVPALLWDEEYDEMTKSSTARIACGWYYRDEVPAGLLQDVDGITLLFAASPKQASHFRGHEIDYQDGKLFFFAP